MPLDPAIYEVADEPWPYKTVAAQLKNWGYQAVGDHSPEYLLDLSGLLHWEKIDPKTGRKKVFVISTPKWRTIGGADEPVWPAKVVSRAMNVQDVFQEAGSSDESPSKNRIRLVRTTNRKT